MDENDPHVTHQNGSRGALEFLSLATDFLSIPLCLMAIFADVLILYVILKYKRLRTRANYYLLNFATFHIVYIISTPCLHIAMDLLFGNIVVEWYCTWLRLELTAIFLLLTFAAGFGLDAYLYFKKVRLFNIYENYYHYAFITVYVIAGVLYAISTALCFATGFDNNFCFYFIFGYFTLLLTLVAYGYVKRRTLFHMNNYAIKISLFVHLCYLPLFVCYMLMIIAKDVRNVEVVLWYTAFLPEFLAYCSSMVVAWKLYNCDKHYKVAFRKLFRRPVPTVDYDELNQTHDIEVK